MAIPNTSASLAKSERLSRELIINQLFKEGKSISQNGFTLIYLATPLPTSYPAQAAFSAPKRNFKRAIDRNRVKRLLREAYRTNKNPLYERAVDLQIQVGLMLIYKGKDIPTLVATITQVQALLARLILMLPMPGGNI